LDHLSTNSSPTQRYKDIARERYLISKHTNTSYVDTSKLSPIEREYMLEFIVEDLQRQKEIMDEAKAKADRKK
jgi:AAA15 family ATPase/GTPase